MSKWTDVRDFINSHQIFTKKEMRSSLNIKDSSNYTEGQYVNHIMNAGFVKRTGRGKYERIAKIPPVSSNFMLILSYNKEKRDKFMIAIVRKQKLQILNEI